MVDGEGPGPNGCFATLLLDRKVKPLQEETDLRLKETPARKAPCSNSCTSSNADPTYSGRSRCHNIADGFSGRRLSVVECGAWTQGEPQGHPVRRDHPSFSQPRSRAAIPVDPHQPFERDIPDGLLDSNFRVLPESDAQRRVGRTRCGRVGTPTRRHRHQQNGYRRAIGLTSKAGQSLVEVDHGWPRTTAWPKRNRR